MRAAVDAAAAGARRGARSRGRHCPDCGAVLVYYPHLSSPAAPDGRRMLAYSCPECTDDFERPRMIAVRRAGRGGAASEGIETIYAEIIEGGSGGGAERPAPRRG